MFQEHFSSASVHEKDFSENALFLEMEIVLAVWGWGSEPWIPLLAPKPGATARHSLSPQREAWIPQVSRIVWEPGATFCQRWGGPQWWLPSSCSASFSWSMCPNYYQCSSPSPANSPISQIWNLSCHS